MGNKPNLDFLRTVAVIAVVLDHTLLAKGVLQMPGWPGRWQVEWIGVFGVYLFFVHTSLVLMWSLQRRPHVFDFYVRRVFRIYPLAIVAVLAAIVTRAPVAGGPGNWFVTATLRPWKVVANLLLVQNLAPYTSKGNIVGVLWSLPLEVQMYLLLPALFFLVERELSLLPLLLLWGLVVRVASQEFLVTTGNIFPTVIPDFLPGIMAYVGFRRWRPRLPAWSFAVLLAVLLMVFMWRPNARTAWPVCLALGLTLPTFRQFTSGWLTRVSHLVAQYSFGIYLSHPFAIAVAIGAMPRLPVAAQVGVEIALTAAFSVAGYHLVERPMIRAGSRIAAKLEQRHERVEAATEMAS